MDLIKRQDAINAIHCDITITGRQNAELVAATIGAFTDRIKALPSAEPEQTYNIMDFVIYQVAWLESHNDIELEPELEKWMVRMLYDTAKCYIMEHPEPERKTGKWIEDPIESQKHIEKIYECSACHNNQAWGLTECTPFCSLCGAKMLGRKDAYE